MRLEQRLDDAPAGSWLDSLVDSCWRFAAAHPLVATAAVTFAELAPTILLEEYCHAKYHHYFMSPVLSVGGLVFLSYFIYARLMRDRLLRGLGLDGKEKVSHRMKLAPKANRIVDFILANPAILIAAASVGLTIHGLHRIDENPSYIIPAEVRQGANYGEAAIFFKLWLASLMTTASAWGVYTLAYLFPQFAVYFSKPAEIPTALQLRYPLLRGGASNVLKAIDDQKLGTNYFLFLLRAQLKFRNGRIEEGFKDAKMAIDVAFWEGTALSSLPKIEADAWRRRIADNAGTIKASLEDACLVATDMYMLGRPKEAVAVMKRLSESRKDAQVSWYCIDFMRRFGAVKEANDATIDFLQNLDKYNVSIQYLGNTLKPTFVISGPLTEREVVFKGGYDSHESVIEEMRNNTLWQRKISKAATIDDIFKDFDLPKPVRVIDFPEPNKILGSHTYVMSCLRGEKASVVQARTGLSNQDLEHIACLSAVTALPEVGKKPDFVQVSPEVYRDHVFERLDHMPLSSSLIMSIKEHLAPLFLLEDFLYCLPGCDDHKDNFLISHSTEGTRYARVDTERKQLMPLQFAIASFEAFPSVLSAKQETIYEQSFKRAIELLQPSAAQMLIGSITREAILRAKIIKQFSWYSASYSWQTHDGSSFCWNCMDAAQGYAAELGAKSLMDDIIACRQVAWREQRVQGN